MDSPQIRHLVRRLLIKKNALRYCLRCTRESATSAATYADLGFRFVNRSNVAEASDSYDLPSPYHAFTSEGLLVVSFRYCSAAWLYWPVAIKEPASMPRASWLSGCNVNSFFKGAMASRG